MQIGTIRTNGETRAARLDGNRLTLLPFADVGAVLRADALDAAHAASGESVPVANADWAPLVTHPEKIVCVGLNYREHIRETGSDTPAYPTYFAKYRRALIGANDEIRLPAVSTKVDWEIELCIVIGREGRNIDAAQALDHVAGYSILNDTSMRDFQRRTKQFLAGKTFEHSTPVGPVMTTTDTLGDGSGLRVHTTVDGVTKQDSNTDELLFTVPELVADLSTIITLEPGDLIATGTPSGVGNARTPQEFLAPGSEVVMTIDGIGELRNRCEPG